MKKRMLLGVALVGSVAHICAASAQTLPPACEQYAHAVDVCMANTISVLEVTDPGRAKEISDQHAGATFRQTVAGVVKSVGALETAKRCASAQAKEQLGNMVTNLVVPLAMTQALSPECEAAAGAIR